MNVRTHDAARLVALAAIWGASFVLVRVLAPVIGPWWVAAGRLLIGGVAIAVWLALAHRTVGVRAHWRAYAFVGVLNSALPFVLWAYAALRLPASYLVILNAMSPLFGAAIAPFALGERLDARRVGGLVAGTAGVVLVTRAVPVQADTAFVLALCAGLAAALCYALSALWIKRRGAHLPPMGIAAWSQVFGGALVLPFAFPSHVTGPLDASVGVNVVLLGFVCSGIAYVLYYRLIRDIGPTRALTVTFLIPAFGMLWAFWLLGESITAGMIGGAALIIGGTAAVLGQAAPARHMRAPGNASV
ncbi:MAG TPA: DMT family transporter [Casimicrobiaceae bacterium]|jgi:drug/metabolite transporter (DMT)-like permease|nr:DMT family transporter [Casimicrobiaceae bacterium]